jgi:hypothetical protein
MLEFYAVLSLFFFLVTTILFLSRDHNDPSRRVGYAFFFMMCLGLGLFVMDFILKVNNL